MVDVKSWPDSYYILKTEGRNFLIWIVREAEKTGITTKQLLLNMQQCLIRNHMAR